MNSAIAIVGMACEFPDAHSPQELWDMVLAKRRAFRRLPACRLRGDDYFAADRAVADATYSLQAAVLDGWEFDRASFQVTGSAYRSADLVHWLALDVAARALADAGFARGKGLPTAATGVVLGNTLTGEFSRAATLRLRWPYVRRVLEERLAVLGMEPAARAAWLAEVEARFKAPFPPVNEETLAGGLSNTIAGRICNHFDFNGGAFTVDGACSSSLLAVTQACSALVAGDLDVALAGGVDLSLDPFELIGFAKAGALAPEQMRVYDARAAGFWPGEGCGFVVLMRQADAVARGLTVHACIHGWGISSDGAGGITRPEAVGQGLALERAWRRAGMAIGTAAAFEGHGTGTAVGDRTELEVLLAARRASPGAQPAALGSIKANFGHTKAAAGIAGLIKAALVVREQILPPATGVEVPHDLLRHGDGPTHLRLLSDPEPWCAAEPLRVGVSAMGFGGINTHVVLAAAAPVRRTGLAPREAMLSRSAQDVELFVFAAEDRHALRARIEGLAAVASELSLAELTDLSVAQRHADLSGGVRAAVVAATPGDLATGLARVARALAHDDSVFDPAAGVFVGRADAALRLGFLFPGQGAPAHLSGGAIRRRFLAADEVYQRARLPSSGDGVATEIAQPAIVAASLAGLAVLAELGVTASAALGHSLGELAALCWAEAIDADAVLRLATARGRAMAELSTGAGGMASVVASGAVVEALLGGAANGAGERDAGARAAVAIAGLNADDQTVVSGAVAAVDAFVLRLETKGIPSTRLAVSHAFHSPLVAPAAEALRRHLQAEPPRPPRRLVFSTVTGRALAADSAVAQLLVQQVTEPVRFAAAAGAARDHVDLWLEVGPGNTLSSLMHRNGGAPAIALDVGGPSLRGLLTGVGAAFVMGARLRGANSGQTRFSRAFDPAKARTFLRNPCEEAPDVSAAVLVAATEGAGKASAAVVPPGSVPRDVICELLAAAAELSRHALADEMRLLGDLHLNSITVGRIAAQAARRLDLPPPLSPTEFAGTTVGGLVRAFEQMRSLGPTSPLATSGPDAPGIGPWIRAFVVDLVPRPLAARAPTESAAGASGLPTIVANAGDALADALRRRLRAGAGSLGGTVFVCLPRTGPVEPLLLAGAAAALAERPAAGANPRLVVAHSGRAAAGFVRAWHLEEEIDATVVTVPDPVDAAAGWVLAEAGAAHGFTEVRYAADGRRSVPQLRYWPLPAAAAAGDTLPLAAHDVLVVSGGGKGIAAECALDLAQRSGARIAMLGRSAPEHDRELAANLERFAEKGVEFCYQRADVTKAAEVEAALRAIVARWGPVTALLHGAGRNEPRLVRGLDLAAFMATMAAKVDGLRHLLAAMDPARLRLLIAFGSVIARSGLAGEADYAHANEELRHLVEAWQQGQPHCRSLVVEWSVWSGAGMGERLGRVDALLRAGITPIPVDEGVRALRRLLGAGSCPVAVVVAGRLGELPTLQWQSRELPLLRFLERSRVHVPDVELVADTELSFERDPYLRDHDLDGDCLLPAVLGLEAMAQAHCALSGEHVPVFVDVAFTRPIVVPSNEPQTLRTVALRAENGSVDVALRCSATSFQVDHFRARIEDAGRTQRPAPLRLAAAPAPVDLVPERDLYGGLLFQGPKFQRLRRYQRLQARQCRAELVGTEEAWFGGYLPQGLRLGDPGVRDAALHAIQACIPHRLLLPLGVGRIWTGALVGEGPWYASAVEQRCSGDLFVYDLAIEDASGREVERWQDLTFKAVATREPRAWPPALLATYLERRLDELLGGARVVVRLERQDPVSRARDGETARPDGKPDGAGNGHASSAHCQGLRLSVAADARVGCDLEQIAERTTGSWRDLLGGVRHDLAALLARERQEPAGAAATRVWTALECAKKAGLPEPSAPTLERVFLDGWVLLRYGDARVASYVTSVGPEARMLAFAILVREQEGA